MCINDMSSSDANRCVRKNYRICYRILHLLVCLLFSVCVYIVGGFKVLKYIYNRKSNISTRLRKFYYCIAFIPCIATLFAVFFEFAPKAGIHVIGIVFVFAIINGTIEEMFWRGVFNKVFGNNILFAYIYPSLFFGIWHIALFLAKGISYQGGFLLLVGGSLFMGLIWGLVAYKTKSIKVVTIAHIIANFFAFTGLIYENWFI